MDKKQKAKRKLSRSVKFSALITSATLAAGLAVSIPIYLKTKKELHSAIKEASNVNLGISEIAKQLGFSADQGNIEKDIEGGYKLKYHEGLVDIYKVHEIDDSEELVFSIDDKGDISTKYEMNGTAAKTIISIIALVKSYLADEAKAEKEILVPFLKEIIKRTINGGQSSKKIATARKLLAKHLVESSDLLKDVKTNELSPENLKDKRNLIVRLIQSFYAGFASHKDLAEQAIKEWDQFSKENLEKLKEIIGSSSEFALTEILKYQGYTMDELMKYFNVVRFTYEIMQEKLKAQEDELNQLLNSFKDSKDLSNIFKKISTSYSNTIIAVAKTFGLKNGTTNIKGSQTIRDKLFDYLKENLGLHKDTRQLILDNIKSVIGWTTEDPTGKRVIDVSSAKKIVIDNKVYSVLSVMSYKNNADKEARRNAVDSKYVLLKSNLGSKNLWDVDVSLISETQEKIIINLASQVKLRNYKVTDHLNSFEKMFNAILSGKLDKSIELFLTRINMPVNWMIFIESINSKSPIKDLLNKIKKVDSYKPFIKRIINEYDGPTLNFSMDKLDTISKKLYKDPNNPWTSDMNLGTALEHMENKDEFHNKEKYAELIITALIQGITSNGWDWAVDTLPTKSFFNVKKLLNEKSISDFKNIDVVINEIIDAIGRT